MGPRSAPSWCCLMVIRVHRGALIAVQRLWELYRSWRNESRLRQ
jgi:hypothetical protein